MTQLAPLSIPPGIFESLFPFHIAVSPDGTIRGLGKTACAMWPDLLGGRFETHFLVKSPQCACTFSEVLAHAENHFLLERLGTPCLLRGQVLHLPKDEVLVFLVTPWLYDSSDLVTLGLGFKDFALHDATMDMLHLHQTAKVALEDSAKLSLKLRERNQLLRQREAELRESLDALEEMQDGVFVFDSQTHRISFVNRAGCLQTGKSRTCLLEETLTNVLMEYPGPRLQAKIAQAIQANASNPITHARTSNALSWNLPRSVHFRTHLAQFASSQRRLVQVKLQFLGTRPGRGDMLAVLRDITEQEMAESISRRNQRIESMGLLAAGLAHDLNNALTPITLTLESLRQRFPSDTDVVEVLENSTRHATGIVQRMLGFVRCNDGNRIPASLSDLVLEVHSILRLTFPNDIRVDLELPPASCKILGDPTQIHQVLLNLCINARDAMLSGGQLLLRLDEVSLDTAIVDQIPDAKPGRHVKLTIKDTGTGIDPSIQDRIFDPFFTTKDSSTGSGLGLSMALGIVRNHGGFIRVESQVGIGTVFELYFPSITASIPETGHSQSNLGVPLGSGQTVLLVDEEEGIRIVGKAVLQKLNYRVVVARDGMEALSLLASGTGDVQAIIMDVHMTVLDGLSLARDVRARWPELSIIAISGRCDEDLRNQLATLGCTRLLPKPFTQAQLAESLSEILVGVPRNGPLDDKPWTL